MIRLHGENKKHFPIERFSYIIEYSGLEIFVIVRSMPKKSAFRGLFCKTNTIKEKDNG